MTIDETPFNNPDEGVGAKESPPLYQAYVYDSLLWHKMPGMMVVGAMELTFRTPYVFPCGWEALGAWQGAALDLTNATLEQMRYICWKCEQ